MVWGRAGDYGCGMPIRRHYFPEHDLTLHVVWGKHTTEEVIEAYRSLDPTYATRWLSYFGPTAEMSPIAIADAPEIKRVRGEKRREIFGDAPKPFAMVCRSKSAEQFFFDFWQRYSECLECCFRTLEEAYDWLGLSEAARAAVERAIDRDDADFPDHGLESRPSPG
jgi:hypothetical protein